MQYFYPRSPCGERRSRSGCRPAQRGHFYPRSPCGERRQRQHRPPRRMRFYPRSPCGERQFQRAPVDKFHVFLSTLSLRRATAMTELDSWVFCISIHALLAESDHGCAAAGCGIHNFYPRSPCGERRAFPVACKHAADISIHALLAESDPRTPQQRFLF